MGSVPRDHVTGPRRRSSFRPMVIASALLHGLVATGLVWGPSVIPRPTFPQAYQVRLVSLPTEDALVSPEPPRVVIPPKPDKPKPAPKPVAKKPAVKKTQKKTDGVVKPTESKSKRPAIAPLPAEEAPVDPVEEPSPPSEPRSDQVAKLEHTEPGITLVTPLMEAVALKFPLFMKVLQRKVYENWSPPDAGSVGAQEALVAFTIRRDGSVDGVPKIEQSSGNPYYDQAALRAVNRSIFPPLPPAHPDETMKIYFSFFLDPDRVN